MERSLSLFLVLAAHLTGVAIGQTLEKVVGTLGDAVTLTCHGIPSNRTLPAVEWLKDGRIAASRNLSSVPSPSGNAHFTIADGGNLTIIGLLLSDEGTYRCNDYVLNRTTPDIQLLIVSGPTNMSIDVKPAAALPNGTLFVRKDSAILFSCSSESYPSQVLTWVFRGGLLSAGNTSSLEFSIPSVQPANQGTYSCISENALSDRTASRSASLLVYYAPDRHPECYCNAGNDSSHLLLHCSWPGSYPLPMLQWGAQPGAGGAKQPVRNVSVTAESLEVTLNRSQLYDGQTVECKARNQMLNSEVKFCSITLRAPFPQGEPMVTAVEGRSVTLTCSESSSLPPARTTWQRKISQEDITPGAKYTISELGPAFSLRIANVSKEDEGPYFCRSENPLGVQELEVYLTVKSSESYVGGVIGVFIAALIIGIGIAAGTSAYRNRDRICLGGLFGLINEERNDVLQLVESDEDDLFDWPATGSATATANGRITSLVQIHRIPSIDHEDLGTPETEAEAETQRPPEELVTL